VAMISATSNTNLLYPPPYDSVNFSWGNKLLFQKEAYVDALNSKCLELETWNKKTKGAQYYAKAIDPKKK
jgi:hypothetical protein